MKKTQKSYLVLPAAILIVVNPLRADSLVTYTEFLEDSGGDSITSPTSVGNFLTATDIVLNNEATIHLGEFNADDWSSPLPYIQGNSGWDSENPILAKGFSFTLASDSGYVFDLTEFRFEDRATNAGPSAATVFVNGTSVYSADITANTTELHTIDLTEFELTDLSEAEFVLAGWDNGFRDTSGGGQWRTAGYEIDGVVSPIPEPSTWALMLGLPALIVAVAGKRGLRRNE